MNEMKFTGIVTAISKKTTGESNGKAWEKQSFVLTEEKDKYPQAILVEAFNKPSEIEKIQIGDKVEVQFNMNAKEYKGVYYGSNSLWRLNVLNSKESAANVPQNAPTYEPTNVTPTDGDDTLPF